MIWRGGILCHKHKLTGPRLSILCKTLRGMARGAFGSDFVLGTSELSVFLLLVLPHSFADALRGMNCLSTGLLPSLRKDAVPMRKSYRSDGLRRKGREGLSRRKGCGRMLCC